MINKMKELYRLEIKTIDTILSRSNISEEQKKNIMEMFKNNLEIIETLSLLVELNKIGGE